MRFSQDFIDRVLQANNLVDVIGQYTQLKPAGQGYMGRCPFPDHPEKTPSFSVSELKQVYNCFGCHKKGNLFTFLMEYQGLSFPDAVEFLANRAGLPIPTDTKIGGDDTVKQKRKDILHINKVAAQFYRDQLLRQPESHPARRYLMDRGLFESTQAEFQVGWSSSSWDDLANYLKSKNLSLALAEEARLVKARKEGNGYFDVFRERVLFPIWNPQGDVVGFGGRIIGPGEPKYLNSPETPVFHKGRIFYGANLSAKHIRAQDQALLVEGYMDLVSLYQSGFQNVIATMGTALTLDHAKAVQKMTSNVVVLFDGDSAGRAAAERSLPLLLEVGVLPKALILPEELDPDDFLKQQGGEALRELLAQAPDLFSWVLNSWLRGYRGETSQKVEVLKRVEGVLARVEDPRTRRLCLEEVARKLGVELAWIQGQLKPQQKVSQVSSTEKTSHGVIQTDMGELRPVEIVLRGAPQLEIMLLQLALSREQFLQRVFQEQITDVLMSSGVLAAFRTLQSMAGQVPTPFDRFLSLLATKVDRPELLMAEQVESEQVQEQLLVDVIRKLKIQALQRQAESLALEVQRSQDPQQVAQAMQKLVEIQKQRRTLELRKVYENEAK